LSDDIYAKSSRVFKGRARESNRVDHELASYRTWDGTASETMTGETILTVLRSTPPGRVTASASRTSAPPDPHMVDGSEARNRSCRLPPCSGENEDDGVGACSPNEGSDRIALPRWLVLIGGFVLLGGLLSQPHLDHSDSRKANGLELSAQVD